MSLEWRDDFIRTYLKRDLPDLGPNLPAEQVYRLWRMPYRTEATFYRTSAGAEIDLLLERPRGGTYAIEIKRTLDPKLSKGFRFACEDIQPTHRFYVIPIEDSFPMDDDTQAIGVEKLLSSWQDFEMSSA